MFCKYCGEQMDDLALACPQCGVANPNAQPSQTPPPQYQQPMYQEPQYQQPQYQQPPYQQPPYPIQQVAGEKKGFGIASMVLGIVAVIFGGCFWYISIPCGLVGLILGIISNNANKNGMAMAGIVTSLIALAFAAVVAIFFGSIWASLLGLASSSAYY